MSQRESNKMFVFN